MNLLRLVPIDLCRQRRCAAQSGRYRYRPHTATVALTGYLALSAVVVATEPSDEFVPLLETTPFAQSASRIVSRIPAITEPVREVALSVPVRGVLMDVCVREGQTVAARQIVAVMDNRVSVAEVRLAAAIEARQAAIREAQCQLRLAENLLARLLEVQRKGAVSELEIDQAHGSVEQAKATLDQARERAQEDEIQLELARARLESFNVRAPFAGRVLRIERHPGETVTETDAILTLADLKVLRAELYVPLRWYGQLAIGDCLELAAAAPVGRTVAAKLTSYEPVIDAGTQTFRCVFEIDNSNDSLPAGFAVQLIRPDSAEATQPSDR